MSSTNRGNKYNSFNYHRNDDRAKIFKEAYNSKKVSDVKKGKSGKGKC